jgi:small subunit ribosomal protein S30e
MGKVHGSLAQAGKVRSRTKKVERLKPAVKPLQGRAALRKLYNKRFLAVDPNVKKRTGPNSNSK